MLNVFANSLAELVFYVQYKVQIELFIKSEIESLQQKQLYNLLDSLPDKVLICPQKTTKGQESLSPKVTYLNKKMSKFLGIDLPSYEQRKLL